MMFAANSSYDAVPITPKKWEEVDLAYVSAIKGKRYTNTIQLLRPIGWLKKHHMMTPGHRVDISIPQFGLVKIKAMITAINPTQLDTRGIHWSAQQVGPVIGRFKHYATDVRVYTFRDHRGQVTHIDATPNHPFFVKNKSTFVAISQVTDTDQLIVANQGHEEIAHLVCVHGQHRHCGKHDYRAGTKPIAVYNLEVYRRHVYRVGAEGMLVHNVCIGDEEIANYINHLVQFNMPSIQSNTPTGFFNVMRDYSWSTLLTQSYAGDELLLIESRKMDAVMLDRKLQRMFYRNAVMFEQSESKFAQKGWMAGLKARARSLVSRSAKPSIRPLGYDSLESFMATRALPYRAGFDKTYGQFFVHMYDLRALLKWDKPIFDAGGRLIKCLFAIWPCLFHLTHNRRCTR